MKRRFSSQFLGMNSVIVYQGAAAYLIDPGVFPPELQRIRDFIDKESFSTVNILLTHTHGDHISGWKTFNEYSVFIHRCQEQKTAEMRANDLRYVQGMYRKQGYDNFEWLAFPDHAILIDDGKFISLPPFSFAFFHVPGHSTDMTAIIVPEEKLMLSGDMLIQTPIPFILHSIGQYWKSLQRLQNLVLEYEINCLIPGHGKPASPQIEIMERIDNERKYVQELIKTGTKLVQQGLEDIQLKEELELHFPQWAHFHAHQVNVQTFLREYPNLMNNEFLDFNQ